MDQWFKEINDLAIEYPELEFILPIHPNPEVQKHKYLLTNISVVEPLSHPELLEILVKSKFVISDSGGLQEEGSFFNKKVIVCRKVTERPEAIHTGHLHICNSPNDLKLLVGKVNKDYYINTQCPYGDGKTSEKIKKILCQ